jgi:hypothetical protein
MKSVLRKIWLVVGGIICVIILIVMRINKVENAEKVKRKDNSIGLYKLSLPESKLGEYTKDSARYSKLELNLNEDMSFVFSISTPFVYDSSGVWATKEVGIYGYNQLIYNRNREFKNQISPCCFNNDRIQIKLPISREGFEQVELLVFRKVN